MGIFIDNSEILDDEIKNEFKKFVNMNTPNYIKGYNVSKYYRKLTVYSFDPISKKRISTNSYTPLSGFTLKERYKILCEKLEEEGLPTKWI